MDVEFSLLSDKGAPEFAHCIRDGIAGSEIQPAGDTFRIRKSRFAGPEPEFDVSPRPEGGSVVTYDNRLGENEALEVVRSCV